MHIVIHPGMAAIEHEIDGDIVNAGAGTVALPALDINGVEINHEFTLLLIGWVAKPSPT